MQVRPDIIVSMLLGALVIAPMPFSNAQHTNKYGNQSIKEAQALGVVITINQNEISSAKLVLKKLRDQTNNQNIKDYAQMMKRDHTKNYQTILVISHKLNLHPIKSPLQDSLIQESKKETADLTAADKNQIPQVYMDAMVKDHSAALNIIDKDLLPYTKNTLLKNHLINTRATVYQHLLAAKSIQAKLGEEKKETDESEQ